MRTTAAPAPGAPTQAPPPGEELSWDAPQALHGESRAPRDDEPARGFLLRLHADPSCGSRLVPDAQLIARRYESVRADQLCHDCALGLVASSASSVVRRLREAERTLLGLRARIGDGPMPREIVHCRAIRFEAENTASLHPDARLIAVRVAALATNVADGLRDAMAAYDRHR